LVGWLVFARLTHRPDDEAVRTSETLVNFYQTTRCYNPEDSNLHTHRRENLKSYMINVTSVNFILNGTGVSRWFSLNGRDQNYL
jgi:hypothetical protein